MEYPEQQNSSSRQKVSMTNISWEMTPTYRDATEKVVSLVPQGVKYV